MNAKLARALADETISRLPNHVISDIENLSCCVRDRERQDFRLRLAYLCAAYSYHFTVI